MPYTMPKTHPEDALSDIENELEAQKVELSLQAHARLAKKFYATLGKYLGEMGALNPDWDVWHDSRLLVLHEFVSNCVVKPLAARLTAASGGSPVPPDELRRHLGDIMGEEGVKAECLKVIAIVNSVIIHPLIDTPICDASSLIK